MKQASMSKTLPTALRGRVPTVPLLLLSALFLMGSQLVSMACRYSVRDVGFVELQPNPYQLVFFYDSSRTDQVSAAKSIQSAAAAVLLDSNVRLELADVQKGERTDYLDRLGDTKPELPFGLIISPDDRTLSLNFEASQSPDDWKETAWKWTETVVKSVTREKILNLAPSAYSIALLVEGSNAASNEKARQSITTAILEITEFIPSMPKPVDTPPKLISIPAGDRTAEKILLWSLGLDWKPGPDPQAAVLMGKGRRIGPTLPGPLITATRMREVLSVIGQDCECELDRSWMQGPMMPAVYDRTFREKAFIELGFDPENPSVKSEISRIISRGPNSQPGYASNNAATPANTVENLFMGYSEQTLATEDSSSLSLEELKRNARALMQSTSSDLYAMREADSETTVDESDIDPASQGQGQDTAQDQEIPVEEAGESNSENGELSSQQSDAPTPAEVSSRISVSFTFIAIGGVVLLILLVGGWIILRSA